MKKYTIIYGESGQCGCHSYSIPKFDYIETNDIKEFLKQDKYDCTVHFVFDGYSQMSEDWMK